MTCTKIVATIGPASDSFETISQLLKSGANVFRFNLKHNTQEWQVNTMKTVRDASQKTGIPVAILADLPGIGKREANEPVLKSDEIDFIGLSYIRSIQDIHSLRSFLNDNSLKSKIIAKIETVESLNIFEEILEHADGIMVARGDLGVELPIEQVPFHQKNIIKHCLENGKPVITATQMLESMIENPTPTRAEVSDVANAIYDCTDAIMLSAETAIGKHPIESVETMVKIATFIESKRPSPNVNYKIVNQTESLAHAAHDLLKQSNNETIKAFVVITESGHTAQSISRLRPKIPVIALAHTQSTYNQLLLLWGVIPIRITMQCASTDSRFDEIVSFAKQSTILHPGDSVIMIYSNEIGQPGNTNTIRMEKIK
jgi:pyruvate kinase